MTPESRNSPLLDNGSPVRVSAGTDNNKVIHELSKVVVPRQFVPSYKREFIRELIN
jgi:hypothetical protein